MWYETRLNALNVVIVSNSTQCGTVIMSNLTQSRTPTQRTGLQRGNMVKSKGLSVTLSVGEREIFIDNLLVRVHLIIEMSRSALRHGSSNSLFQVALYLPS